MDQVTYQAEETVECILKNIKTGWERLPLEITRKICQYVMHQHPLIAHVASHPLLVQQSSHPIGCNICRVVISPHGTRALLEEDSSAGRGGFDYYYCLTGNWEPIEESEPKLNIYSLESSTVKAEITQKSKDFRDYSFSPNDEFIVSSSTGDNTIRIWNTKGDRIVEFQVAGNFPSVQYSHNGSMIGVYADELTVWETQNYIPTLNFIRIDTSSIEAKYPVFIFSPDDKRIAVLNRGTARIFDLAKNKLIATFKHMEDHYAEACFTMIGGSFSLNGNYFSTSGNGEFIVWHIKSSKSLAILEEEGMSSIKKTIALHSEHTYFASLYVGCNFLNIWHVEHDHPIAHLEHDKSIHSAAFSPESKLLASGALDGIVKLWRTPDFSCIAAIKCTPGIITRLQFTPDGQQLIVLSGAVGASAILHKFDLTLLLMWIDLINNCSLPQVVLLDTFYKISQEHDEWQLCLNDFEHLKDESTDITKIRHLLQPHNTSL